MSTNPTTSNISKDEDAADPKLWAILDSTGFPSCEVDYYRLVEFIADQQRQLLDHLEAKLPTWNDLKGNADTMQGFIDAMNLVDSVIKDIREGLL